MNAHVQSQFQPQFQAQPQSQQQNVGQARQGQQSMQNPKGNQGSQNSLNQYATYDPQIALWTLEKGRKNSSWEDVKPQQQHVSLRSLQEELVRIRSAGTSVKRSMKEIISENARQTVNSLVPEQNLVLWQYNPNLQWIIAGIDITWKDINRRERRLKSIDIVLTTEPRFPGGRPKNAIPGNVHDIQDPMRMANSNGMPQDQHRSQATNSGHAQGHSPKNNQNQGSNMGPSQHFDEPRGRPQGQSQHFDEPRGRPRGQSQNFDPPQGRPQGQGQGQNQGQGSIQGPPNPPPPPPPPPPNMTQQNMAQGMSGPPPPPPPPNGPNGPKQQQQHQHHQNPQQQAKSIPGSFPEPGPYPSMRHGHPAIEILNSHALKKQKSKSKNLHRDYSVESESDSDSDSDSDSNTSGSDSYGAVSGEEEGYGFVEGRSRSSSCKKSNSRNHSMPRSPSRGRVPKALHNDRPSHVRHRSNIDPPPMGKYSGKSTKSDSPRSSAGALQSPQIHIHMNSAPATGNDRGRERGRESDRDRDSDRDHERARDRSRGRIRDSRRSSYETTPLVFQKETYGKPEKLMAASPMSRNSSLEHGSDTASYIEGSSSIYSAADDSVFSEPSYPTLPRGTNRTQSEVGSQVPLRSRALQRPHEGTFQQSHPSQVYQDVDRRPKLRHPPNDYPHNPQPHVRPHHGRNPALHSDIPHDGEESYYDDHGTLASWPQRPPIPGRHNSMQIQYHHDQARYQPQRTLSYTEHIPDLSHNYAYPAPQPQAPRYLTDPSNVQEPIDLHDVVEVAVEVLQQKNLAAMEHMQRSQRQPLMRRRNTVSSRAATRENDEWANPMPVYGNQAPRVMHRAPGMGGGAGYV